MPSRSARAESEDKAIKKFTYETHRTEILRGSLIQNLTAKPDDIKLALAFSEDEGAQRFLRALTSPKTAKKSIYHLAKQCGLTPSRMVEIMRDYYHSSAVTDFHKALGETTRTTIQDAQSTESVCPRCDGAKRVEFITRNPDGSVKEQRETRCPNCRGKGVIRQPGSAKAQEVIYRATKVLEAAGPLVQIDQRSWSGPESILDELDRKSRPPRSPKPVVDIEAEP